MENENDMTFEETLKYCQKTRKELRESVQHLTKTLKEATEVLSVRSGFIIKKTGELI